MQGMLLLYQTNEIQYNTKPTKCLLVFVLSCLKIPCDRVADLSFALVCCAVYFTHH